MNVPAQTAVETESAAAETQKNAVNTWDNY